jgi:hypothetical protein
LASKKTADRLSRVFPEITDTPAEPIERKKSPPEEIVAPEALEKHPR